MKSKLCWLLITLASSASGLKLTFCCKWYQCCWQFWQARSTPLSYILNALFVDTPTWLCSVCLAKSPKSKISKYLANLAACTAYCQVGYPWKEHWKCSSEVLTLSSYDRGATLQLEYYAEVVCAPLGRWVGECTFCETRPRPAGPRWIVGMVQF